MKRDEFKNKYFNKNFYWINDDNFVKIQEIAIEMGLTWHTGDTNIQEKTMGAIENLVMFEGGYFQQTAFYSPDYGWGEPVNYDEMINDYNHLTSPATIGGKE